MPVTEVAVNLMMTPEARREALLALLTHGVRRAQQRRLDLHTAPLTSCAVRAIECVTRTCASPLDGRRERRHP